jgi:hypothetical protein
MTAMLHHLQLGALPEWVAIAMSVVCFKKNHDAP